MKKVALTVAVLALGLAACQDNAPTTTPASRTPSRTRPKPTSTPLTDDCRRTPLDAAGNAVENAGNAVENAGDAVENAADNAN